MPSGGTFGWLRRLLPFGGGGAAAADTAKQDADEEEFGNSSRPESDEDEREEECDRTRGGTKRTFAISPSKAAGRSSHAGSPFKRPRRTSPAREPDAHRASKGLSLNYSRPLASRGWNDPPTSLLGSRSGSVLGYGRGLAGMANGAGGSGLRRSETMGNVQYGSIGRASPARSVCGLRYAGLGSSSTVGRGSSLARERDFDSVRLRGGRGTRARILLIPPWLGTHSTPSSPPRPSPRRIRARHSPPRPRAAAGAGRTARVPNGGRARRPLLPLPTPMPSRRARTAGTRAGSWASSRGPSARAAGRLGSGVGCAE